MVVEIYGCFCLKHLMRIMTLELNSTGWTWELPGDCSKWNTGNLYCSHKLFQISLFEVSDVFIWSFRCKQKLQVVGYFRRGSCVYRTSQSTIF